MRRYVLSTASAVLLALALAACSQSKPAELVEVKPGDDFYTYINQDWLAHAEIPADGVMYSVAQEVSDKVHLHLSEDVYRLVTGEEQSDLLGMDEFRTFYQIASDFDKREQDGTEPAKKYLEIIGSIKSLEDLNKVAKDWTLKGYTLPFGIFVGSNAEQTDEKQLTLDSPEPLLPDVSYYEDPEKAEELLSLYGETAVAILEEMGYDLDHARQIFEGAKAFDAAIVPYLMTAEEASEVKNTVNPRTPEEVARYSKVIDLAKLSESLVGQKVDTINVATLRYFENMDQFINSDNFDHLKNWLILQEAMSMTDYLNEDVRQIAGQYQMSLYGVEELPTKEDVVYDMALDNFSPTLSVYYGKKYFGEEAKQDVTHMVDTIIDVYKDHLAANDWLSEETRNKAIDKLDQMTYYIGYPEEVPEEVALIDFDENKTLLDNMYDVTRVGIQYSFEHFNEPLDKDEWNAPSYEVNAFYMPTNNSITFPAAILSAPFYDPKQTDAENYGGIGVVIGHEITHAFDSNGALFDGEGNMKNWWTEEDFKAFEAKIQGMVEHFDGADFEGNPVSGRLTVTENTADAGGMTASLEALKRVDKKAYLKDFFENYAKSWRSVVRPEAVQYFLLDEHAPDKLRVNLQVNLLEDFYELYDVKEGDALYLPADKRPHIW